MLEQHGLKFNTTFQIKSYNQKEETKMISAYVLGKVEAGTEKAVLNSLQNIKEMKKQASHTEPMTSP